MRPASAKALLLIILLAQILILPAAARTGDRRVTAILSSNGQPYREHVQGFSARFNGKVDVEVIDSDTSALAASLKRDPPDLVLAIGSSAARFAARSRTSAPVFFTMVYSPERNGLIGKDNVCGISLRVPPDKTLEALLAIKPRSIKSLRVGSLYSKSRGGNEVSDIEAAVTAHGHRFVRREVVSAKEVGPALKSLLKEIDALWLVADPVVLPGPDFLKVVLNKALDAKVAVVGLSDAHVEMGALVSVSVDYRLEGETAARIASEIVSGKDISDVGVLPPQNLIWSLNRKVAKAIGWPVTRMTRQRFERVYP